MTRTASLRLTQLEFEEIKVAAQAAHLPVGTYLYKRVFASPIISTPRLAALAQLISLLQRLEVEGRSEAHLMDELRELAYTQWPHRGRCASLLRQGLR